MPGVQALPIIIGLAIAATASFGQAPGHDTHALGHVDFPVSCSPAAQVEFDRAVALLHHMTYSQARLAFEGIAARDPSCAMAHWGIAMTLFQPLWPTRPGPEERQRGWNEVRQALALAPHTERERLFVAAASAFFAEPASPDYWLRIRRWEEAMAAAHVALPDDPEASAFYALALLATAPSDRISREHADQAAVLLLDVYAKNPDHPGAMHYLVHADDVPGRERETPEIVTKYETIAPENPHALHMPTHIATRLGDWPAVIAGNERAADAALAYPAGDRGQYVWDEFPHAVEYLVYAELQRGDDAKALAQLSRLRSTPTLEPSFKTAFHLASTGARYALERGAWDEAIALPVREPATLPWDRFPWPEAVTWFARGYGAARLGRVADAQVAEQRLAVLERAAEATGELLFTRNIQVLHLELRARLAQLARQPDSSVALMRAAAALEEVTPKHAVTPAPTIPAHELLGDLLLEQGQPMAALAAYQRSLELYPRRLNGLLGAARAAVAAGDAPTAREMYRAVLDVAVVDSPRPGVREAQEYLTRP